MIAFVPNPHQGGSQTGNVHECKAVFQEDTSTNNLFFPKVTMSAPSLPIYIVNVQGLDLRGGPAFSAPQSTTLNFGDGVGLLETSGGWLKAGTAAQH